MNEHDEYLPIIIIIIGGNDGHSAGRYRNRGENKWNNSQQSKICRRHRSDGGKRKPTVLQELTTRVHESSKRFGLKINGEKTKTMTIGKEKEKINITLEGEELEQVTEFVYLGGVITEDAESTRDIRKRIGQASAMFGKLRKLWRSGNKNKNQTIRNTGDTGPHVWSRVLVHEKGGREKTPGGGDGMATRTPE